jgi:hypothetical protein
MPARPFHLGSAVCRLIFAVALLGGAVACEKKGPPPLPRVYRLPPKAPKADYSGVNYRRKGGQSIAPEVIADDPVAEAQPTPTGAGTQGGNATINGDPNGITRDTLNRSIQGAMGALAACFTNITQDPMVAVSFEADPSGRPSLVRVTGAPPDAEHCIRNVVQGMRFPTFQGKGVQVDLPLSFHRTRAPAAQAAGEQPAQAAAPPLFLEP